MKRHTLPVLVPSLLLPLLGACDTREASAADHRETAATDPGEPAESAAYSADEVVPVGADAFERISVDHSDLDGIVAAKRVRVLTPYARPFFFFRGAEPRGITYEIFREYGTFLEEREGLRRGDLEVIHVPCELDSVIPWLEAGLGDIAAGALTVTPERADLVAFSQPIVDGVEEIIVTSSEAAPIASLEDLAGREVWVAASSSYAGHLRSLSAELEAAGLAPIVVTEAPVTLSTEDLFEMTSAGIVEVMVSDGYKAELWAEVLDGLRPRTDLVLHGGGQIAWAVRRDSPELLASLDDFVERSKQGTLLGNVLIDRYFGTTKWIENPLDPKATKRLAQYERWIRDACEEHGFDWLRVAAQCFQESGLDPNAKSYAGAIGLMQLLPATAKDMGCDDPYDPDQNIRAGVKYLAWLRDNFFDQPELDEINRMDLILAAYNAGPGNVRKWRRKAPERGLDPNVWRGNVERLALEHVGVQPIRYVDNIEKFYVAYTLSWGLQREREQAMESMEY
jgi:membrane-bound lytic murein transglycosylase MltF